MDVEQTIRKYLPQIIHMSLATCVGGQPWICEVHYAFDDELNLYFRSTQQRRHSKELALNSVVAGSMVTQHFLGQKVRGVSFEGVAELLKHVDEDHVAYKLFCERFGMGKEILENENKEDGHSFYKITVNTFYLFDSYDSTPSRKYELMWK